MLREGTDSPMKMKFEDLRHLDGSLAEIAQDLDVRPEGDLSAYKDFDGWYRENIFCDNRVTSDSMTSYCERLHPHFLCCSQDNFTCPVPRLEKERQPRGRASWLTKWKNRTVVKFSRSSGKSAECGASDVRSKARLSTRRTGAIKAKREDTQGIHILLLALEYLEKKDKTSHIADRLNRMHVMESDMEKAGEGAPDLAKLLEDHAPAKELVAPQHQNGVKTQETETVEPVNKEVEEEEEEETAAPEPTPEIKEEVTEDEATAAGQEGAVEEEKPQSRPQTPKEEETRFSPPPPPIELSRKRDRTKEAEVEGSSGSESESSRKRNKMEQETEPAPAEPRRETRTCVEDERERMMSEFVTDVSTTAETLADATERLHKEIENLGEMLANKEMEWNTILRVRKLKEEMLERLLRRKRIQNVEEQPIPERFSEHPPPNKAPNNPMIVMRSPRFPDGHGKQQRPILPKPSPYTLNMSLREGRNGPIIDVKSIIDDYSGGYRSRHPEGAPRRGRRVRGTPEQRFSSNPSLISMANIALGTGASVRTVSDHVYNVGMEQNRRDETPLKEVVKPNGAKPYPEVTLHPVSPPSLLHQVLTKSSPRPASFSPTLARLLTAPERPPAPPPHFRPPSRVSINDILTSTKQKNRNEITITPVSGTAPPTVKSKEDVVLLDDDDGEAGDRLVIDEGSEEVPQCQGCRHKSAQFVCAGCGNQWYCSRDCQVSAWEEHSEVCTG